MSTTVKLSQAITAHEEDLSELTLREPSSKDLMELGYPYLIIAGDGEETKIQLQPKVVARYVSRLAAIPPSSVEKLSFGDLQMLQGVVMGFFGRSADSETLSK